MDRYYVYALLDPRYYGPYVYTSSNFGTILFHCEPFYIGKGTGNRYRHHFHSKNMRNSHNKEKELRVKDIYENTKSFPVVIKLFQKLSEEEAFSLEKKIISLIGRVDFKEGYLLNLTDGGGGLNRLSKESIKKISLALRGENHYLFGKTLSEETKRKISLALSGENHPNFGVKWSEEIREKMSESAKGRIISKEAREKISLANRGENHPLFGKGHTEESKNKIRQKHLGKILSEEHKEKIRTACIKTSSNDEIKKKIEDNKKLRMKLEAIEITKILKKSNLSLSEDTYNTNRLSNKRPRYKYIIDNIISHDELLNIYLQNDNDIVLSA